MTSEQCGEDDEPDIDDDWDWDTELGLLDPGPEDDGRRRPWVAPAPDRAPDRVPDLRRAVLRTGGLGTFLRACRAAAGLSQRELAAVVGVPQSTVARAEADPEATVRFATVCRLVEGCGVSLVGVIDTDTDTDTDSDADAEPLQADRDQQHRDAGGRALPAHLVNQPVGSFHGAWWGDDRYTHRRPRPRRTYPRRAAREGG